MKKNKRLKEMLAKSEDFATAKNKVFRMLSKSKISMLSNTSCLEPRNYVSYGTENRRFSSAMHFLNT